MSELLTNMKATDYLYLFVGIVVFDTIVLAIARYFPGFLGANLNRWYDSFHLNAVLADILSIFLGFMIARWIFLTYFPDGGILYFAVILVLVQLVHDLLFYYLAIRPIPRGHNGMMDIFKDYAFGGGSKILLGDATLMIGSLGVAWILRTKYPEYAIETLVVTVYTMIYLLYTRWQ